MNTRVMELRIKQWIPIIEEQTKSGISKNEWCTMHGISGACLHEAGIKFIEGSNHTESRFNKGESTFLLLPVSQRHLRHTYPC